MYADLLKFIFIIIVVIFPLGKIILDLLIISKVTFWEEVLLSVNIGIVFITICAFLLGLIGNQNFILILIWLPLFYLLLRKGKQLLPKLKLGVSSLDPILIAILLVSTFVQSIITFPSGNFVGNRLRLVGIHDRDSLWYIALIESV